jgi:hypothetical protein
MKKTRESAMGESDYSETAPRTTVVLTTAGA